MLRRIKIDKRVKTAAEGVQPTTEDWIDLSTSGTLTLAPNANLGYHDHTYDIVVGPKGGAGVWAQDATGIYPTVDGGRGRGVIIHPGACSLRYDPIFEIVFYCSHASSQIMLLTASEAVGDHAFQTTTLNGHRGIYLSGSTPFDTYRAGSLASWPAYGRIAGHHYRALIDPEDGGRLYLYDLGVAPISYDGGTLVAGGYISRSLQLLGGNVIAPYLSDNTVATFYSDRLVATRTTMRRP